MKKTVTSSPTRPKVMLYAIKDFYGRRTPQLYGALALEYPKTYRFVGGMSRVFGYRTMIHKEQDRQPVYRTPKEAMQAYITEQEKIIENGKKAATRKSQVLAMLKELESSDDKANTLCKLLVTSDT